MSFVQWGRAGSEMKDEIQRAIELVKRTYPKTLRALSDSRSSVCACGRVIIPTLAKRIEEEEFDIGGVKVCGACYIEAIEKGVV